MRRLQEASRAKECSDADPSELKNTTRKAFLSMNAIRPSPNCSWRTSLLSILPRCVAERSTLLSDARITEDLLGVEDSRRGRL